MDHPPHYGGKDNPYEVIKVIEAWRLGFALGNAVKYIARADHKGVPIVDLEKARWYLEHEILRRNSAEARAEHGLAATPAKGIIAELLRGRNTAPAVSAKGTRSLRRGAKHKRPMSAANKARQAAALIRTRDSTGAFVKYKETR